MEPTEIVQYPRTHRWVYGGRRVTAKGKTVHAFFDTENLDEDNCNLFKKKPHTAGIGSIVEVEEVTQGSFKIMSAKRVGYLNDTLRTQTWQVLDDKCEAEKRAKALAQEDDLKNTIDGALLPIIKAMRLTNEPGKTAILGLVNRRLVRALVFGD